MELTAYLDFGSPYSYLAWKRIMHVHPERYAGVDVVWKPVSAGHIFAQDGTAPRASYPNQKSYLEHDVPRWAGRYGIPFAPPPDGSPGAMPVRSIEAMRLWFAAREQGLDAADAWTDAVFDAYFGAGRDISDRHVLDAMAQEAGIEGGVAAADAPEHKQALIDTTTEAYQAGAPGVPYFLLDGERYWGNDRLVLVEERLGVAAETA